MECLGIPVDHRLRSLIRERKSVDYPRDVSNHVDILHEFGLQLRSKGYTTIDACAINFALELARPITKGGVVVILDQPANTQQYWRGFIWETEECKSLAAVQSLISLATNGDVDSVSVFDAVPLVSRTMELKAQELRKEAQEVFVKMIKAKEPDIVITCFSGKSSNKFIWSINSIGIGRTFDEPYVRNGGSRFRRVNAFHPSTVVNYQRSYSCLRQLLILEFVMAFNPPTEKFLDTNKWIQKLRDDRFYDRQRLKEAINNKSKEDPKDRWSKIDSRFSTLFVQNRIFFGSFPDKSTQIRELVASSNITQSCCDIGLFLEEMLEVFDEVLYAFVEQAILLMLKIFCSIMWPSGTKNNLEVNSNGYFVHDNMMLFRSDLQPPLARRLHDVSITFLRDLNLSFTIRRNGVAESTVRAQQNAFLRFARAIEDTLEWAARTPSSEIRNGQVERVVQKEAAKYPSSKSTATVVTSKEIVQVDGLDRAIEKLRI